MSRLLAGRNLTSGSEDTLLTLRRILTVGIRLADTAGLYAWGLDREFAVLRAAGALCLMGSRTGSGEETSRDRGA